MYILDTSAIRGISRATLKKAAEKTTVAISTLSVLELASHLNDSNDDTKYSRARGNFLKCQECEILDDPFWLFSQHSQLPANITRKEDRPILTQLIAKVEQSQTLNELAQQTLVYPDGATASCEEVGKRIAKILHEEEKEFISNIQNFYSAAKLDPSLNGKHSLTSDALFETLLSSAKALSAGDNSNLRSKTLLATAPYIGYILHRLYLYANRLQPGEFMLNVDRNDCEDAYISLSLNLNSNDTLVTNDTGTLDALNGTIALLSEKLPEPLSSNYVMSSESFLSLFTSGEAAA
ncbi:hypothetical protein BTK96_000827 [Burkholderia pyrrocinia]|nr:hypothetical protein [Burkholderia pyrrocinia]EKS9893598.1 hypothetical protein [Burkholderia pyrrocinia]EKS9905770.1 hypothetical protein [Burkholderia pyrrocinia]